MIKREIVEVKIKFFFCVKYKLNFAGIKLKMLGTRNEKRRGGRTIYLLNKLMKLLDILKLLFF